MSPAKGDRWVPERTPATPGRVCKDCRAEDAAGAPGQIGVTRRPAPHPGPRCATHHNAERRRRRLANKARRVENTYGLTAEQYDELLAFQGGTCAICRVAKGVTKRLAVDHDHHQAMRDGHDPDKGCPKCVRGLVCSTCNDVLAHARSMPAFGYRLAAFLELPPLQRMQQDGFWPPLPPQIIGGG